MGIEGRRAGVPLYRDEIFGFRVEQEFPQAGSGGFTPFAYEDIFIGAKDGNGVFLLEDFADILSEGGDAHKVVGTVGTVLGT